MAKNKADLLALINTNLPDNTWILAPTALIDVSKVEGVA